MEFEQFLKEIDKIIQNRYNEYLDNKRDVFTMIVQIKRDIEIFMTKTIKELL